MSIAPNVNEDTDMEKATDCQLWPLLWLRNDAPGGLGWKCIVSVVPNQVAGQGKNVRV